MCDYVVVVFLWVFFFGGGGGGGGGVGGGVRIIESINDSIGRKPISVMTPIVGIDELHEG